MPTRGLSKMLIIGLLGLIALIIGTVVVIILQPKISPPKKTEITVWGVWDNSGDLDGIIRSYKKLHPYVDITYKKMRFEEYEDQLIKNWANEPSTGPDIYAIPNTWITAYKKNYIKPLPKTTSVYYYTTKKTLFKKETKIEKKVEASLTVDELKRAFINVVNQDVTDGKKIFGLPLSINTLVMYYNKDFLNQAHLISPPATWAEFSNFAESSGITLIDEQNNIIRASAALGTANNVPHASDIITLLMLQNNTQMVSPDGQISFQRPLASDPTYFPGAEALRFYTDFASPDKTVYTWNEQMPNALDYFATGKLAFYLGYSYEEPEIQSKNRGVNYGIAPVPQVDINNETNYANYWVYTVAKKAKDSNTAWNFLQFAASLKMAKKYLKNTKQTSVLTALLKEELNDPDRKEIAQQALTAKSWYHGRSPQNAQKYFDEMVRSAASDPNMINEILVTTAQKINSEYK